MSWLSQFPLSHDSGRQKQTGVKPEAVISLEAPDDER
jgi:hypothetical protein